MGACGWICAWLPVLATVPWCAAELATLRNVSVTFLSHSTEQAFQVISVPPTEWPERAGTEIGMIPPSGVGPKGMTFMLKPGTRYRLSPTKCPARIRISGMRKSQSSKNGEYYMSARARLRRPIYKHVSAEHFLYYWPQQKHWRLGENPDDLAAGVDSGDAALCPNHVTVWQEWNDTDWEPQPSISVQDLCGTAYIVQELPGVLGAYNGHYFFHGSDSTVEQRPVFQQRPGQAFLYYSQEQGTWVIGSQAQSGANIHAESMNIGSRCPDHTTHWRHPIQGGGYVPHKAISVQLLRLSHYDRFAGHLVGTSLEAGVMTYQEAERKCASSHECAGFSMQGNIKQQDEKALFHIKANWELERNGPGGGWSSFRRTVEGSWDEAVVAPADFQANSPGEITVTVVDTMILLSGVALARKPFVPTVPLGMSPPVPPLTPDGGVMQVPARQAEPDFSGLLPEPRPTHEAARFFYAERPAKVLFTTNVSGLLARLYWFCTRSASRRPMAFITREVRELQTSHVGHRYEVMVSGMQPKIMRVMDEGTVWIGVADGKVVLSGRPTEDATLHYRGPQWDSIISGQVALCNRTFGEFPQDHAHFCSEAHAYRSMNRAKFDHMNTEANATIAKNDFSRDHRVHAAPSNFQNFTKRGFWVTKIPGELLEKLQLFVNKSRRQALPAELPWDDAVLLGRESDVWKLTLPEELERDAVLGLRKGLEKFSKIPESGITPIHDHHTVDGSTPVHLHHEGVQVRSNVFPKAALSAYLELGRNDPEDTTDWPLMVTDHSGVTHEVPSKVGQVVIVEAATCAVARPKPFSGREFAQLTFHFRVPDWPSKYLVARRGPRDVMDKSLREEL